MKFSKIAMLVAFAGLAAPAFAQDSVSNNPGGTDGDALSAHQPGVQVTRYVVDGSNLFGSRGNQFYLFPMAKTSKLLGTNFFNNLPSAYSLSQTIVPAVGVGQNAYSLWTTPGGGVNPDENDAGTPTTPSGNLLQFAATVSDFGTIAPPLGPPNFSSVITAIAQFDPAQPSRLFVTRVQTAVNGANPAADSSQFGVGGVDALGNTYFRGDGFGGTTAPVLAGSNVFRIPAQSRNQNVNVIDNNGSSQFGNGSNVRIANNSTALINTPTAIPADLAGNSTGRAVFANFDNTLNLRTETNVGAAIPSNITATSAQLLGGAGSQRGSVAFSQKVLRGGVGTGAIIRDSGAGIAIWGLQASGAVINPLFLSYPLTASTADGSYTTTPGTNATFDHYRSQTNVRGGNSPVAVGSDPRTSTPANQRGLVAGVVYTGRGTSAADWPFQALVVGRFDPSNGSGLTWKVAAYSDQDASFNTVGSPISGDFGADGAPFTNDVGEFDDDLTNDAPIGRLTPLGEVTGGTPQGPSISAPVFDSVGNIYFIASVALNKFDSVNQVPFVDFDSALLRAVYNPADFSYTLELLAELGDTFDGQNSGVPYQIQFLEIADSNSVSSGTMWSSAGTQAAFANADASTLGSGPIEDTRALGGLVFSADVVYDVNGDGDFNDPSSGGGDPASPDESYSVLFYLGHRPGTVVNTCPADFNGDTFVDDTDFVVFAACYEAFIAEGPCVVADFNSDGFVDDSDFVVFAAAYEAFVCP